MDSKQVAADTAALQSYIEQMKNMTSEEEKAGKGAEIFNSTLKDSSKIAHDVARNTNNLDDVMKVYTASTRTATSVAKKRPSFLCQSVRYYLNDRLKVSI